MVCLTAGPQPLPKTVLHRVRSSASSFNLQCLLFTLKSSSSCLLILLPLPVTSSLYLSFNDVFKNAIPTQDGTITISFPSFSGLYGVPLPLASM